MSCLNLPVTHEAVALDLDRLTALCQAMEPQRIEECISLALERIAVELSATERAWCDQDWDRMLDGLDLVGRTAGQFGMIKLAAVAGTVRDACETGDRVAISATLARLLRVGERSLIAVWDRHGVGG
ncbi:hypothetical protein [Roseivivax sediminis]|uniref:Hpt domain-containing protein n=1 Tax=Roseivivax sediminis TaxID=936889 RepID=A0A1I1UL46_9RHOB|nr:hypothetical protein [Roseivivax sediminis]SFD71531.1 hypothetical protein SAMN04515678_102403 [Roseivivax sediminis]